MSKRDEDDPHRAKVRQLHGDVSYPPQSPQQFARDVKRRAGLSGWLNGKTIPAIVAGIVLLVLSTSLAFYVDTTSGLDGVKQVSSDNEHRSKTNASEIQQIKQDQAAAREWRKQQTRRTNRIISKLESMRQ